MNTIQRIRREIPPFWERLVDPPAWIQDPQARVRSRFLAALTLVLVSVVGVFILVALVAHPWALLRQFSQLPYLLASLVFLFIIYSLNRAGRYRVAAWSLIAVAIVSVVLVSLPFDPPSYLAFLVYLLVPVLFANLLLTFRAGVMVNILILAGLLLLPVLFPYIDLIKLIYLPFVFLLIVSTIIWLTCFYNARMERARQGLLLASQARIRESEYTYRQLVEFSPEPILIHDGQQIVFSNAAGAELLGAPDARQLLGENTLKFLHPNAQAAELFEEALRKKTIFRHVEHKLIRLDGTLLDVEASGIPIIYQDQPALQLVFRDIARHKQIHLLERNQRIVAELMRETVIALTSSLDLDEVLDRILDYLRRVLPHDVASVCLVQSGMARVVRTHDYTHRHMESMYQALSFHVPSTANLRWMAENRRPLLIPDLRQYADWICLPGFEWVRAYVGAPICIGDEVIGFISLDGAEAGMFSAESIDQLQAFADQASVAIQNALLYNTLHNYASLLEQRVAQRTAEIARVKERVETILNSASDAILLVNEDGRMQQVNPAFTLLFGCASDQGVGQALSDFLTFARADELRQTLATVRGDAEPARVEVVARRSNGSTFPADVLFASIPDTDQRRIIVCSVRDISAQKQVEEELRKALRKERELSELKSQFTTTVSHEFRTPLAAIMSSSDLLRHYGERLNHQRKAEHLQTIQDSVAHLTEMLEDALFVSQSDLVGLSFAPEETDILALCREIVVRFARAYDSTHGIRFHAPEMSACPMRLDRRLVKRILTNLLSNAIKYSPEGGNVWVSLACEPDRALIQVRDEGLGILEQDQRRIFERFQRGSNTGTIPGVGLGLAIVGEAVQRHGGAIRVESQPMRGTTFIVELPRYESSPALSLQSSAPSPKPAPDKHSL